MPSRTLCFLARWRTTSVMSTIWLRCLVLTGSAAIGCECMEVSEISPADRSTKTHARRGDELEVVLAGALIENPAAKMIAVEDEPQVRQRAGDLSREATRLVHVIVEFDDEVMLTARGKFGGGIRLRGQLLDEPPR